MKTNAINARSITTAAVLLLLAGCSQRLIDFTIISSKNVDLTRAAQLKRTANRVNGEDTAYTILFIPLGTPHIKDAVDRAIEAVPGAVALVDGVVRSTSIWFILGGSNSIVVEGTALVDPALRPASLEVSSEPIYTVAYIDSKDVTHSISLTRGQFEQAKVAIDNNDSDGLNQLLAAR